MNIEEILPKRGEPATVDEAFHNAFVYSKAGRAWMRYSLQRLMFSVSYRRYMKFVRRFESVGWKL